MATQMSDVYQMLRQDNVDHKETIVNLTTKLDMTASEVQRLTDENQKIKVMLDTIQGGVQSLPIPFWCKTDAKEFLYVNPEWVKLTGITLEQAVGETNQSLAEMGLIPQEVADDWDEGDNKALALRGKKTFTNEHSVTARGPVVAGRSAKWSRRDGKGLLSRIVIWGVYVVFDDWIPGDIVVNQ